MMPIAGAPQPQLLATKLETRAATAGKLVTEWYPRINVLLFEPGHPLPGPAPQVRVDAKPLYEGVPAYANDGVIHLWAGYIENQDEADFEGMVIHELTHINQAGKHVGDNGWVVEGVADYVRHKYFARDIEPTLHMTADGRLQGYAPKDIYFYGLQQRKANLTSQGYQARYTVASTFLYWLELRKDSHIVHEISVALEQGTFTPALFEQTCGKPLDALWDGFVVESKQEQEQEQEQGKARVAGATR